MSEGDVFGGAADDVSEPVLDAVGHLSDGGAHAFVDGALSDEEAARVVLHLGACSRCAMLVAEARGLAAAAAGVVRRLDDGPGSVAVLAPAGDRVVAQPVVRARRAPPRAGLRAAAAALVAAALGGSAYVASRRTPNALSAAADSAAPTAPADYVAGVPAVRPPVVGPPAAGALAPAPAIRAARPLARAAPTLAPRVFADARPVAGQENKRAAAAATSATSLGGGGDSTVASADAARAAIRLRAAPPALDQVEVPNAETAPSAAEGVASRRRLRRSAQTPAAGPPGCFAVTGAPVRSPVRLAPSGAVVSGGDARGSWSWAGDSLRVRWGDAGANVVTLGRLGAGWTGGGVRLAPAEGPGCDTP